jgi:hypothetical protein
MPEYELFDRAADPTDQRNLAGAQPEVIQSFLREVENFKKTVAAVRLPGDATVAEKLRSEEVERLKALGYVN